MNVDFYHINDRNRRNLLFFVDEKFFIKNHELLKKEGIEVDIYGTIIVPASKINTIISLLKSEGIVTNVLENIFQQGEAIVIEGN